MINTKVGAIKQQKPGSGFSLTDNKDDKLFKNAGDTVKVSPDFNNLNDNDDDLGATVVTPLKAAQPTVQTRDLNPGQTFGKNYQIVSLIGKGGMSAVYKAYDKMLKRNVAVKVLLYKRKMDKKARARFVQEGIALSKLDHPNLIRVYEFGDADSSEPYLVMDYLEGAALSDLMSKTNPMSVTRAISILKQCTLALRHAHNKGVVHRDLKPSNIMITANEDSVEDVAKIIDFGIAKVEEADSMRLTETGEVFGSPLYMSPEQCRGEKLDERSDMYSLGCVFFEMLTGVPPFKGLDFADTVGMHFNDSPASISTLRPDIKYPAELDKVINKLMEKERSKRYQNMDELAEDVEPLYEKHCPRHAFKRTPGALPVVVVDETEDHTDENLHTTEAGARTFSDYEAINKRNNQIILALAVATVLLAVGVGGKIFYDYQINQKQKRASLASSKLKITPQVNLWLEQMKYGDLYFDKGDLETAEEYFEKALSSAKDVEQSVKNQHIVSALQQLIDVDYVSHGLKENSAAGIQYKSDSLALEPETIPALESADGIIRRAKILASNGNLKEARELIESSIASYQAKSQQTPKDLAMMELAAANLYWVKHDEANTKPYLELAEKNFTTANLPNLALLCKAGQQLIDKHQNDCQISIDKLLPKLREELPRPDWAIAIALDFSAAADAKIIETIKAFDKMQKELNLQDPTNDSRSDMQEYFDSAEAKIQRTIAILSRTEPYNKVAILAAYHNLMNSYMDAKQNDKLELLIPTVLAYGEKATCEAEVTQAQLTQNLAFLKCMNGRYDESESLYKKALAIANKDEARNGPLLTNILGGMRRLANDRLKDPGRAATVEKQTEQNALRKEGLKKEEAKKLDPDSAQSPSDSQIPNIPHIPDLPPALQTQIQNLQSKAPGNSTVDAPQRKQFSNHTRHTKPVEQLQLEDTGHGKEL